MCGNSTPVGTGGAGVCGVMLRRPFLRSLECRQLATKSGSGENGLPPRVQLQRVSHPWRALGTWERLRGTQTGTGFKFGLSTEDKGTSCPGHVFGLWPSSSQLPALSPASPKCWLDGDPDVAPLSGGHPVPLCCPGFLLEKGGCLPTVGKDEERGDRAKCPHPHRTGTPANGPCRSTAPPRPLAEA